MLGTTLRAQKPGCEEPSLRPEGRVLEARAEQGAQVLPSGGRAGVGGVGRHLAMCLSLTFSPLAPASPRRPGSPGGPCGERESHSFQGEVKPSPPPLPAASRVSAPAHCPGRSSPTHPPPPTQPVTHHRTWGPSLTCGPRTTLLALQIEETPEVRQSVPSHGTPTPASPSRLTTEPGSPLRPSGPGFPAGPAGPTGPVFPGAPTAPGSP